MATRFSSASKLVEACVASVRWYCKSRSSKSRQDVHAANFTMENCRNSCTYFTRLACAAYESTNRWCSSCSRDSVLTPKTVDKFLHCHDPLVCLLIQALDMHLRMLLIPGCMPKIPRTRKFCRTRCNNLSSFLNYYPILTFALHTPEIQHTNLGVGHNG